MGGYGSGRWGGHSKKATVEDALVLPIARLVRDGIASWGDGTPYSSKWTNTRTKEVTASITHRLEILPDESRILHFIYTSTNPRTGEKWDSNYPVRLVTTHQNFGGLRWFFLCPLVINGRPCLRRAAKLYLPPGGIYFGCRECYGLTYTSSQESHKFDGLYKVLAANVGRGLTPKDVKQALKTPR
jgi:hypothetical protein